MGRLWDTLDIYALFPFPSLGHPNFRCKNVLKLLHQLSEASVCFAVGCVSSRGLVSTSELAPLVPHSANQVVTSRLAHPTCHAVPSLAESVTQREPCSLGPCSPA
jgi:hypothetical protein